MNNVFKNENNIFMHEIIVFMHEIIVYKNNYFMQLISTEHIFHDFFLKFFFFVFFFILIFYLSFLNFIFMDDGAAIIYGCRTAANRGT